MDTKLTLKLKLNKKAIEKAKKYAEKHNQSLSSLVEEYFNLISEKEKVVQTKISPTVLELYGIIKLGKNSRTKSEYGKYTK